MRRYKLDPQLTKIYFCTCTIVKWLNVFEEERYINIIIDSLNHCRMYKGLLLYGYVIMPNHIHLMVSYKSEANLSDIMRDFKRHTSTQIAKCLAEDNNFAFLHIFETAAYRKRSKIKVWQDEYHPIAIVSEKWFHQKMNYMHDNPVRKRLVNRPEEWKYSSARNWMLDDHSILTLDLEFLGIPNRPG